MLLNTPRSISVTSRLAVSVRASGTLAGGELFLVSSITILLGYSRFIRIRTRGTNGLRAGSPLDRSDAPELSGSGASVLSNGLLAAFDQIGDQGVAVLAVSAHAVGCVRAVYERDDRDQGHHRDEKEADQNEHEERRHGPSREQNYQPGHLVPHRLQGLERHPARPIPVDQPDNQSRHGPEEPGNEVEEDAQMRQHRPGPLLLGPHSHRTTLSGDLLFDRLTFDYLLFDWLVPDYPVIVVLRLHQHSSLSIHDLHEQKYPGTINPPSVQRPNVARSAVPARCGPTVLRLSARRQASPGALSARSGYKPSLVSNASP